MEERKDGLQEDDYRVRTQSPDPYASNPISDKEPDLLHCQNILNEVTHKMKRLTNTCFLRPILSPTLKFQGVNVGPIYFSTMRDKIARGLYSSSNLLKADFDCMIADYKRLNPRDSFGYTAAEELAWIFEQMWSAERTSGYKSGY